jgi:hypothetical protein
VTIPEGRVTTAGLRREIETLLRHVTGVRAACVETTAAGEIAHVHVVTDGTLPPSLQRRQIRSALLATHDLDLDPDLVTLVPLTRGTGDGDEDRAPFVSDSRLRLHRIGYEQDGLQMVAHVEVARRDRTFHGASRDADTASGRVAAAARAALRALEQVAGGRAGFQLEALDRLRAFDRDVFVVTVRAISESDSPQLLGCAKVREDPSHAAAQAVLTAVNRWLGRLLTGAGRNGPPATRENGRGSVAEPASRQSDPPART